MYKELKTKKDFERFREERIKNRQKLLFSKIKVEKAEVKKEKPKKAKKGKSETKISEFLEDLIK